MDMHTRAGTHYNGHARSQTDRQRVKIFKVSQWSRRHSDSDQHKQSPIHRLLKSYLYDPATTSNRT